MAVIVVSDDGVEIKCDCAPPSDQPVNSYVWLPIVAVEGLVNMLAAVEQVRKRLRTRTRLLGILLTMVAAGSPRVEVREDLRAQFKERVFHTEISVNRALEEAPAHGQTIFQFAPKGTAADAFRRLAGEILERISRWK